MFQKNAKPDLLEKLIYGSGQIGLNALYTLFSSYVLLFYTDVIGINAATIGLVVLISKFFDGFSDLIAGQLIDTHKNKYGHCIPVLMKWTIPMVIIFLPAILSKVSKQKLTVFGSVLILVAQIAFILGPSNNVAWLLGTGLIRGFGMGFPMGLNGAMIGDCIDYGEWKTGIRVQSVLFSSNSVGIKIGQGILTSLLGFFLTAVGYDGLKEVQDAATIAGIDSFFKYIPVIVAIVLIIFSYLFDLEKKLPSIQKELEERRGPLESV